MNIVQHQTTELCKHITKLPPKVEKILDQFINKLNLPWKFEIDNEFQINFKFPVEIKFINKLIKNLFYFST